MRFLGEVSTQTWPTIKATLSSPAYNCGPFELKFQGLGFFERNHEMTIVWAGSEAEKKLLHLFAEIETRLQKVGIDRDFRPFSPHITIGRNKNRFNYTELKTAINRLSSTNFGTMSIAKFQIFSSTLLPEGPVYTIEQEIAIA